MDRFDEFVHSFVIKIWLEETTGEAGEAVWRGQITHVASAERRFIKNMDEISCFIWPYLEEMGVKPDPLWQMGRRIKRIIAALRPQVGVGSR